MDEGHAGLREMQKSTESSDPAKIVGLDEKGIVATDCDTALFGKVLEKPNNLDIMDQKKIELRKEVKHEEVDDSVEQSLARCGVAVTIVAPELVGASKNLAGSSDAHKKGRRSSDATIMSDSEDEGEAAQDEDTAHEEEEELEPEATIGSYRQTPQRHLTSLYKSIPVARGAVSGADAGAGMPAKEEWQDQGEEEEHKTTSASRRMSSSSPTSKNMQIKIINQQQQSSKQTTVPRAETDLASIRTCESTVTLASGFSESTEGEFTPTESSSSMKTGFETDSAMMQLLSRGIRIFNLNPKRGVEFIQDNGLVHKVQGDDSGNARRVAIFLKHTRGLNKEQIGKVLGGESPQHILILKNFFVQFDLSVYGPTIKGLERALRSVFESFKPPGESQKIERIVETFADKFNEDNSMVGEEANPSAMFLPGTTFLLAYSIILLNVDLHNPNNPRKMLRREFISNLRGLDDGKDLPQDELGALYDRILRHQMRHKVDRDEVAGNLFTHPDKSGWLQKKGPSRLSKWRPRWFILSESTLWYFKHSEDVDPQGFIPLENVLIRTCFDVPVRKSSRSRKTLISRTSSECPNSAGSAPSTFPASFHTHLQINSPPAEAPTLSRPISLPTRILTAGIGATALSSDVYSSGDDSPQTADSGRKLISRKSAASLFFRASSPTSATHSRQTRTRNFWFELYMWDERLNVKSARLSRRTGNFELGQHRTIKLRADSRQEMEQWVELLNRKGRFSQNLQELTMRARVEQLNPPRPQSASEVELGSPNGLRRSSRSSFFRSMFTSLPSSDIDSHPDTPNVFSQTDEMRTDETEDMSILSDQIQRASSAASAPVLNTV